PGRSASRAAFDGSPSQEALVKRSGVKAVYDDIEGWKQLGKRLKAVKHVATVQPPPAYVERYGLYTNPARAALVDKIKSYNQPAEVLDVGQDLARLRMIKQPAELKAI